MSYAGKVLLFNDNNDRTHLIFNHYDPDLTQDQIFAEIEDKFELVYKFGSENELDSVYNSGNVLTEISDDYTPEDLMALFGENSHPDVTLTPGETLDATDVRVILYTKMEPPYGNVPAAQTGVAGENRGGRYFKTNYSLSDPLDANSDRVHQNVWDGYNPVRYVITNTNPISIPINPTTNVSDTQIAFTNVNERSDTTGTASILDAKPKSIFYVFSRGTDEFLKDNFALDENRIYQLVKPYLIGGPVVATTTQELEQQVLDNFAIYDVSFAELSRQIQELKDKDIALDAEITGLKATDGTLQNNIDTKESSVDAQQARDVLQNNINVVVSDIGKISGVISEMSKTQHNYYNYEWTKWSPPPVVDETLSSTGSITMIQLADVQSRENRKRQIKNDTAEMMKDVKADIVKLAKINSTVLELLNDNL